MVFGFAVSPWFFFFLTVRLRIRRKFRFLTEGDGGCFNDSHCLKRSGTEGIHKDNLLIFRSQFKIILNWDLNTECLHVKLST